MSRLMSTYLDHLTAVFREDPFIGRFLLAFEAVLTGGTQFADEDTKRLEEFKKIEGYEKLKELEQLKGLEQIIGGADDKYLDPWNTPEEFLPWLAGWVTLSLRADWDLATKRGFICEIVTLYRRRGTLAGLQRMLEIYLRSSDDDLTNTVPQDNVAIFDDFDEPANYFQVRLTLGNSDPARLRGTQEMARAIIDREKPAHTFYALKVAIPTMRLVSEKLQEAENNVPKLLILGENTWLGSRDPTDSSTT